MDVTTSRPFLYPLKKRGTSCRQDKYASAHYHLARPLIAALHDIEPLGEVHRSTLVSVHAHHLNELSGNGIDMERGVTVASRKDDTSLGSLCNRSRRCSLDALRQEVVRDGHRGRSTYRQQADYYVE